jgi:ipoprotein LpqH
VQFRLVGLAGALVAAASASGCGLVAPPPSQPSEQSGRITIDGHARQTQSVSCSQVQWFLTIDASAEPGHAQAFLQLGGDRPIVQTINIVNIDDINGNIGGDVGNAEASLDGSTYTISGTAVGSDSANPGQTRELPFEIKAPC